MKSWYFPGVTTAMLLFAIWGFSDNLIWDIGQPSNSDPKFVVHGLFFLLWMIVQALQAFFIRTDNFRLHRAFGLASTVIFIGLTLSTVHVFAAVWKGWENMAPFVKANRILFASFFGAVSAGYLLRRRAPETHKRLMVVGTLFVMEPMLSRVFGTMEITFLKTLTDAQLDLYWYVVVFSLWAALFLSLIAHDWRRSRRIHPVTWGGAGWLIGVWSAEHFM